jgi:ubiquinol-cytochrome c reductase iron-sulfur subunit
MKWLWSALALLLGRGRAAPPQPERPRIVPEQPPSRGGESAFLTLLALSSLSFVAFVVWYVVDRLPWDTQMFGLTLGLGFAFAGGAAIVASRAVVPVEEISEPYANDPHEEEIDEVVQILDESGNRLTRRRLVKLAMLGTGGAMGAALLAPVASLGPVADPEALRRDGWRRGLRLVDSKGRPLSADHVESKSFYTAFPEGMSHEELWAPLVVVRVDPDRLELPDGRDARLWAPDGIVAFSKICTHAGCAIALYRAPLHEETSAKPALVCPCHYSTFDPATGGGVLFGPAGRPLPQLPLLIDDERNLRAAGPFSGNIGPSWWGVRRGGKIA